MNRQAYTGGLNQEQERAVFAPMNKPLKVMAGAGTGKTRTLTSRYIHFLVDNPGLTPDNLLALTFTDKAAAEMKGRITRLCREMKLFNKNSAMLNAWIGTFHSICSRILRENSLYIGWDPGFVVLTDLESKVFFNGVLDDILNLNVDTGDLDLSKFQHLPFAGVPAMASEIYSLVGKLKDLFLTPGEFRDEAMARLVEFNNLGQQLAGKVNKLTKGKTKNAILNRLEDLDSQLLLEKEWISFIYVIYLEYQARLAKLNAVDFSDLIFMTYRLLVESKELQNAYRKRFKHIFVDEFQDTSKSQFKLLRLLAAGENMSNVTVVGDKKQGIYAWRNARPENMDDFSVKQWGGKEVHLNINYRSKKGILDVAHFSITRQERFSMEEDEIYLHPGREDATQGEGHVLVTLCDRETQAKMAASEVQKLIVGGCRPGDIAVLFRSLNYSKPFEDELRNRGIPYCTLGGTGFYERMEVQDIMAYLKVISKPGDKNSLLWVLMRPPAGLNDNQLYQLSNTWEKTEEGERRLDIYEALAASLDEKFYDKAALIKVKRLLELFNNALSLKHTLSAPELLDYIIANSGYLQYLYTKPENEVLHSMTNLDKLRRTIASYESKHGIVGIDDIIRLLELYQGDEEEAASGDENVVHLMTVHKAKGLEYKYVFIVQVMPGRFPFTPRYPRLDWDDKQGLIIKDTIKYGNIFSEAQFKVLNSLGLVNYKELFREVALNEDRRVFYVALTRGKDRVYLLAGEQSKDSKLPNYYEEINNTMKNYEFGRYCLPWQGCTISAGDSNSNAGSEENVLKKILSWPDNEIVKVSEKYLVLSFTRLLQYQKCPRQYYYSNVAKIPVMDVRHYGLEKAGQDYDAALLGSIVHRVIQHKELFSDQNMEKLMEEEAVLSGLTVEEYRKYYKKQVSACIKNYISLSEKASGRDFYTEKEFHAVYQLEEGTVEFSGYIDRMEVCGDRAKIIDFKTNKVLAADKLAEYSLQLCLYGCAVKHIFQNIRNVELEIWHLSKGEIINIDDSSDKAESVLKTISLAIMREEYPARATKECGYCGYSSLCKSSIE